MNTIKKLGVAFTGILLLSTVAVSAGPASSDAWIGTKGKIALLTTDGAGRTAVKMDTDQGRVTLHGKVESQAIDPAVNVRVGTLVLQEYVRRHGDIAAGLQQFAGAADDPAQAYANKVLAEKDRLEAAYKRRAI